MRDSVLELLNRMEALLARRTSRPPGDKKMVDDREALGTLQMIRAG